MHLSRIEPIVHLLQTPGGQRLLADAARASDFQLSQADQVQRLLEELGRLSSHSTQQPGDARLRAMLAAALRRPGFQALTLVQLDGLLGRTRGLIIPTLGGLRQATGSGLPPDESDGIGLHRFSGADPLKPQISSIVDRLAYPPGLGDIMTGTDKRYFDRELVRAVYYINADGERGEARRIHMRGMSRELGLHAQRVPAVYGTNFSPAEQADIVARTRAKLIRDNGAHANNLHRLADPAHRGFADIAKNALARFAIINSYLRVFEQALADVPPGDTRWTVVFEDDVAVPADMKEAINHALRSAPADAGALMLGGIHRMWSGAVPIATPVDGVIGISQVTGMPATAFRPDMLRVLADTYRRNLALTAEEGGVISVDIVNVILQYHDFTGRLLDLQHPNTCLEPGRADHTPDLEGPAIVVDTFARSVQKHGATATRFYAMNPFPCGVSDVQSTAGHASEFQPHYLQGQLLRTFSHTEAAAILDAMGCIRNLFPRRIAGDTVKAAVIAHQYTFDELMECLDRIKQCDREISERLESVLH